MLLREPSPSSVNRMEGQRAQYEESSKTSPIVEGVPEDSYPAFLAPAFDRRDFLTVREQGKRSTEGTPETHFDDAESSAFMKSISGK